MKMLHCGAISGNIDRSKAPTASTGGAPGSGTTPPVHDLNVPYEVTSEVYGTPTAKGAGLGRGPCSRSARAPTGGGSSGRNSTGTYSPGVPVIIYGGPAKLIYCYLDQRFGVATGLRQSQLLRHQSDSGCL